MNVTSVIPATVHYYEFNGQDDPGGVIRVVEKILKGGEIYTNFSPELGDPVMLQGASAMAIFMVRTGTGHIVTQYYVHHFNLSCSSYLQYMRNRGGNFETYGYSIKLGGQIFDKTGWRWIIASYLEDFGQWQRNWDVMNILSYVLKNAGSLYQIL